MKQHQSTHQPVTKVHDTDPVHRQSSCDCGWHGPRRRTGLSGRWWVRSDAREHQYEMGVRA